MHVVSGCSVRAGGPAEMVAKIEGRLAFAWTKAAWQDCCYPRSKHLLCCKMGMARPRTVAGADSRV